MKTKIRYSVSPRKNPIREFEDPKLYANPQSNATLTLAELAKHIKDHGSVFSKGTIVGVLTDLEEHLLEALMEGNRVQIGTLGTFKFGFVQEGKSQADGFTASDIKAVKVSFEPGSGLTIDRDDVEFVKVNTRAVDDALDQAMANGEITATSNGSGGIDLSYNASAAGGSGNGGGGNGVSGD